MKFSVLHKTTLVVDYKLSLVELLQQAELDPSSDNFSYWQREVEERGSWVSRGWGCGKEFLDRGYYANGFHLPKDKPTTKVTMALLRITFNEQVTKTFLETYNKYGYDNQHTTEARNILHIEESFENITNVFKMQGFRHATIEELLAFMRESHLSEKLMCDNREIHALGTEMFHSNSSYAVILPIKDFPTVGLSHPYILCFSPPWLEQNDNHILSLSRNEDLGWSDPENRLFLCVTVNPDS